MAKIRIEIGKAMKAPGAGESEMPAQREEGLDKEGFSHEEHMAKMISGLKSIKEAADKNDIATVRTIAGDLLSEEEKEKSVEGGEEESASEGQDVQSANKAEMLKKLKGMM